MPAFEKEYFRFNYRITSFDCDKERRLRQSAQMRIQQEAGELHLLAAGYPYIRLFDELGFFFVITRIKSIIHRAPLFGENVIVKTWSKGLKGAQYIRNFEFTDAQGNILIESSGSYAAVSVETGKLLRPSVFADFNIVHCNLDVSCGTPERLNLPEALEPLGVREVRYSDVDYNGHLNNTVYLDFISDYLPSGMSGRRIGGFLLQYAGEAIEGDNIALSGILQDNIFFLEGSVGAKKCFIASAIVE